MATTPVQVKKTPPAPANPPDALRSLRREIDRLFDRFAGGSDMPWVRRMLDVEPAFRYESTLSMPSPAVDVIEDDAAYEVTAELPGMSENEIEVMISGDLLTLKGEKHQEKEKNFYLSERSYGSFRRSFYVPKDVDHDKITADFSQDVLTDHHAEDGQGCGAGKKGRGKSRYLTDATPIDTQVAPGKHALANGYSGGAGLARIGRDRGQWRMQCNRQCRRHSRPARLHGGETS